MAGWLRAAVVHAINALYMTKLGFGCARYEFSDGKSGWKVSSGFVYLHQYKMIHKCVLCLRGDTQNALEIKGGFAILALFVNIIFEDASLDCSAHRSMY